MMEVLRDMLDELDAYGTNEPGFNEGHPEDRCPTCEKPVADHVGVAPPGQERAKWHHRRKAAFALLITK